MPGKLKIFLSYAHEDEAMKTQLDRNLVALKRNNSIEVWQDKAIIPGDVWDDEIKNALATADIILLLISVDFNNSKYIWENELTVALERHLKKEGDESYHRNLVRFSRLSTGATTAYSE